MRSIRLLFLFLLVSTFAASQTVDSVTTIIAAEYDQVGAIHRFWLGDSYRKLYNTPVKMRRLDLRTEKGGLQVVKLGGGMQTQSLRLVDSTGREWVLRSIQKFPERSLQENLRNTIVKDIVQDQIAIAHPFGALTVPTFNSALHIPHAAPELVYLDDDPQLAVHREVFKNRAYMFEPRMPFADDETDNTLKVIRKVIEDNDVQVAQNVTLRARLLDFVLGDWDRHEDNWRWDPEKTDGQRLYTPVPRDRDKVYYKTSGVFPTLLSRQWLKAHLQPFSPHIRNVAHWNFNARHFDRFFLNQLDEKDWIEEVALVQRLLTDSVINEAMRQMPDTIQKLSAAELIYNVRSRRDELTTSALEYYQSLAKIVEVPLSGKNEFVDVEYEAGGRIKLRVQNIKKDGSIGRSLFKRTFYPKKTKEVRIYGIAGKDAYKIHGMAKSPIKLRLIGGADRDSIQAPDGFATGNKIYLYERNDPTANVVNLPDQVRYRLRDDTSVHQFQYDSFVYDRKGVLVDFNYGVDRGLSVGLGYIIENQGFRKAPFAYKHEFLARYLTGRTSFLLDYKGTFTSVWAQQDLEVAVSALGPRNQSNFFGYGNETVFYDYDDEGIEYYRNRYDMVSADIFLKAQPLSQLRIYYGSSSQFYDSREGPNEERYFAAFEQEHAEEKIYDAKFFTGLAAGIDFDTRDDQANATSGIRFIARIDWKSMLGNAKRRFAYFSNALSIYKSIANKSITFANRIGLDAVWGNPYFYQHAQLGGEGSLRGFNSRRFTGKTMLYNNLELRAKLFSFQSYIVPGTVGLTSFYDVGRVWMSAEKSNQWHMGYGGGLYFIPADLLVIQAAVGVSKEAVLPYISVGLRF